MWNKEKVVAPIVAASTAVSGVSPKYCSTSRVPAAMKSARNTMRSHCTRESTGCKRGRGLRSISPGEAWSKPRAMAMGTVIAKLIHNTCKGENGIPPAMPNSAAPRKAVMNATRLVIWKRMYLARLS